MNKVIRAKESRKILLKGINELVDTIKITLGPNGRNVLVNNGVNDPYLTNDGATIAREFFLNDSFDNLGAQLVKESSLKTNDLVGDGTSTAAILTQALVREIFELIDSDINVILLKNNLVKVGNQVIKLLNSKSLVVSNKKELAGVVKIATQDDSLTNLITDIFWRLGFNALVNLEYSNTNDTYVEYIKGYSVDDGYLSPYMINNQANMSVEFDDSYILVCNDLNNMDKLNQLIINIDSNNLVIFVNEIDEYILSDLIVRTMEKNIQVAVVKINFQNNKNNILEDIAILTGSKFFYDEIGELFLNAQKNDLGFCNKIIINKNRTTIMIDKKNDMNNHIQYLNKQILDSESDFESNVFKNRLAKLTESVATIKIGGYSKIEAKEKKMRIEDGISSARATLKDGFSIGGGMNFLIVANELRKTNDEYYNYAVDIIKETLMAPIKQLFLNSGYFDVEKELFKLKKISKNEGYNFETNKIENLLDLKIIDSTASQKVAFESSLSIATTLMTTEAIINIDKPNDNIKPNMDYTI